MLTSLHVFAILARVEPDGVRRVRHRKYDLEIVTEGAICLTVERRTRRVKLTIQLSDERAEALKAQAARHGLMIEQWVEQIAGQYAPVQPGSIAHLQKTNPREWARQFHAWAESHDRTTPLLSDEAVSRESIYSDRISN